MIAATIPEWGRMSGTVLRRDPFFEIGDRLQEICFGQVGDVGVLRLAPAGRQVTVAARHTCGLRPVPTIGGMVGMVFRMPVRRREEIADLRQRVGDVCCRHAHFSPLSGGAT
jgi:hypothetical protein